MNKDVAKWTKHKPARPGWYWCFQYGRVRIVHIWRYKGESDLFTNEDGGASINDSDYNSALWWSDPIKPPVLPEGTIE